MRVKMPFMERGSRFWGREGRVRVEVVREMVGMDMCSPLERSCAHFWAVGALKRVDEQGSRSDISVVDMIGDVWSVAEYQVSTIARQRIRLHKISILKLDFERWLTA